MESKERLEILFRWLMSQPVESEWLEFKANNHNPEKIAEYISALSNSAALRKKPYGYIIWGIADGSTEVIGTSFKPDVEKVGNETLVNWLNRVINPRLDIRFFDLVLDRKKVVILEIPASRGVPTSLKDKEFIRVGSHKKELKDFSNLERELWESLNNNAFEVNICKNHLLESEVLDLLDFESYYALNGLPFNINPQDIISRFKSEGFVIEDRGMLAITNQGAILFAKNLSKFENLQRKALRIILYKGNNKIETVRERVVNKGYANGFAEAIQYINDQLPRNEQIGQVTRIEVPVFPELAVRELIANAIIHQDFSIHGAGPTVEIYADRLEITNPGVPLIEVLRLLDQPPRSRNEKVASFMRRINFCEERGSGIDKVIFQAELFQLPPPHFKVVGDNMIALLYAPRKIGQMDSEEKIRACYWHACLCHVSNKKMTNTTVRERFGISDQNYPAASKIISDTVKAGFIKVFDSKAPRSQLSYVPFWV